MPPSSPPPDRFQREIDDIVRLAEKRLERQSVGWRARSTKRRVGGALSGLNFHVPAAESLAGWGLALLLLSMLLGFLLHLFPVAYAGLIVFWAEVAGIGLLVAGLVVSLTGVGRGGSRSKMWRGQQVSYGNPYPGLWDRLRKLFRGRR